MVVYPYKQSPDTMDRELDFLLYKAAFKIFLKEDKYNED